MIRSSPLCPSAVAPTGVTGVHGGREPETAADAWLVVGADGQLGTELARRLAAVARPLVRTTRRNSTRVTTYFLDLTAEPATWTLPARVAVGFLCAAVTSGARCRETPEATRLVNVERTVRLADLLRGRGAHAVFPSSNLVFDGSVPHTPADAPVCPQTDYGRQKADAERRLQAGGQVTVIRFGKVLAPGAWWLRDWGGALRRGEPVSPFRDMVVSPVPLNFAAEVLARTGERRPGGVIQVTGSEDVTYADIAYRLADRLGAPRGLVRPCSVADRGLPPETAPRNTTLDVGRLTDTLGLTPPPVWDTIDTAIGETFDAR